MFEFRQIFAVLSDDGDANYRLQAYKAREAITNAVRHGHATEVTVDLQVAGQDLRLGVSDNGRGLPAGVELAQGMGMKIMRYRANIVGGRVEIAPGAEGGVQVWVSCRQPLPGEAPSTEAAS